MGGISLLVTTFWRVSRLCVKHQVVFYDFMAAELIGGLFDNEMGELLRCSLGSLTKENWGHKKWIEHAQ